MLTPTRRGFLFWTLLAVAGSACARVVPGRPTPMPSQSLPAEFDAWQTEARAMLSDTLETLQTFEVFAAYRVASAAESGLRSAASLAWDPPTSAAWDEATHVTRGVHGRADLLFVAVTTASVDPSFWREQRALADAVHGLFDLGQALVAYRDRIDGLPPGDASGALEQLDKAWGQWETSAARWAVSRSEPIVCRG